jgi:Geminivirus Rep catalytic domain
MGIENIFTTMLTENGTPKGRMLESKKIDIVEYIGKLGKIFTSVIKSSNWSDRVKVDMMKEYTTVEKMLKVQLKEDGKEVIEKKEKQKRWCAKKFFITISKTDLSKKKAMDFYLNNPKMNIQKCAVARETHKDGTLHLHVYIEFSAKKDIKKKNFFDLSDEYKKYGNIVASVETMKKRTKENVYNYMIKQDKMAYSYGFNIRMDAYGKLKPKEIWYKVVLGEWNIADVVKYDPSYMLKDLEKIQNRIWCNEIYIEKRFKMDFVW